MSDQRAAKMTIDDILQYVPWFPCSHFPTSLPIPITSTLHASLFPYLYRSRVFSLPLTIVPFYSTSACPIEGKIVFTWNEVTRVDNS